MNKIELTKATEALAQQLQNRGIEDWVHIHLEKEAGSYSCKRELKGDDDNILDVAPNTILIPEDADLKKEVFAAIGADKDPVTTNNAFNYQYGRWNVIIWSYLNQFIAAGVKPWILLDTSYNETYGGAVWNDRVKLAVRSTIDENTDANVWRGRSRFNATFNDWRFACIGGITGGTELASLKL